MADISDFISLTITINDASPSLPNFGSLLLAAYSNPGSAGMHTYSATPAGIAQYLTDGGLATDNAYHMLRAIVAQTPHVDKIKWYNTKSVPTTSIRVTPAGPFPDGKVFTLSIDGTVCSYTCTGGTGTAITVAAGLHALANVIPGVTSVSSSGYFTLAASGVYNYVALDAYNPSNLTIAASNTHTVAINTALDAALLLDSDFYGVLTDMDDDTNLAALASWTETNKKLCLVRTKQAVALAGTGLIATLYAAGYHRTGLVYSEDDNTRADAALLGRQLALDPGKSDFQFKNLAGVTVSTLTAGQTAAVKEKNGITYERTSGVAFTTNGTAISGRPLAVTRNLDWLTARMLQLILAAQLNNEIILIDTDGISIFESAIRATLEEAEKARVILAGWKVVAPALASLAAVDTNAGLIKGFTFTAVSGKAARKIQINGSFV